MNTPSFIFRWLRCPLLIFITACAAVLNGCRHEATPTVSPPAVPPKATEAPSPGEFKLGEAPKMPEEKK